MSDAPLQDAAELFALDGTENAPTPPAPRPETPAALTLVSSLVGDILARRTARLARKIGLYARDHAIASDVDPDGCLRRQVYEIERWQDKPLVDPETQARFDVGNVWEREGIRALLEDGFTVTAQQQPFEIRRRGAVILRGRIDGKIEVRRGVEVPFEIKSMHPNIYAHIDSVQDLYKYWWTRKYPYQLESYLIGHEHEAGFLWLTDCLGHWKAIPMVLDLDMCERVFQFAEAIQDAVAEARDTGALPDFTRDIDECARCPFFGRTCQPDLVQQGAALLNDPWLEEQLMRREELQDARSEYEALDASVKKILKAALETNARALVGDFAVTITEKHVKAEKEPRAARVDRIVKIARLGGATQTEAE